MSNFLRKYATSTHVYIPLIKRGVVDFAVNADWSPAAGDVKVSIDGASPSNIGTLPSGITMGNTSMWDFTISTGETTGRKIAVTVADSATKAVEDQMFLMETYGHASAEYQMDLSAATYPASVAGNIGGNVIGTVGGITTNGINEASFASDTVKYQAKVWLTDDDANTKDRYVAAWFKDGQPLLTGITTATIQIIKESDGSDLVASTAMTEIASTQMFKYEEGTNRVVNGATYVAKITALINSSTRTWIQPVSRDG